MRLKAILAFGDLRIRISPLLSAGRDTGNTGDGASRVP